ncbi:MAG: tRNA 2-thiouridine(34) synthase MnmA [Erysipelotrichaceae bacterium]|nr:tRNA 2-thiouridine(34) synthase MnmA [Erysipelotrichaceae bacterium]
MAKVIVGLSGGVDSAVAAYLLKMQGYEVVGAFMRNWDSQLNNDILGNNWTGDICPQEVDYNDAISVAKKLDIPLLRVDFIKEYWDNVFKYFIDEYKKGRTPNPDIMCNKYIKFDSFAKFAKNNGADYIATGHYAKIIHNGDYSILKKAFDDNKDQSYFLSFLSQEQLKNVLFPLADINKSEVREIAHKLDLSIADKKDSTGICFIGERNFKEFLKNYIPAQSGTIVDIETNKVVGQHQGVFYYTIGQRKGLNIGGIKGSDGKSWFVIKKDVKNNILYVAKGDDTQYLLCDEVYVTDCNFLQNISYNKLIVCKAKFRYRQKDVEVEIKRNDDNTINVYSKTLLKAVTNGQIACFYNENDEMIAAGIIDSIFREGKRIELN